MFLCAIVVLLCGIYEANNKRNNQTNQIKIFPIQTANTLVIVNPVITI